MSVYVSVRVHVCESKEFLGIGNYKRWPDEFKNNRMKLQGMKNSVEINNPINIRLDTIKERIGEVEGRTEEITQKTMEVQMWKMKEILSHEG